MPSDSDRILQASKIDSFQPTDQQKRLKSGFWARAAQSGTYIPPDPDIASMVSFGASESISQWWDDLTFRGWFLDRDEFLKKAEHLAGLALEQLQETLTAPKSEVDHKTRLAAIRMALEVSGKIVKGQTTKDSTGEDAIDKMDQNQLQEFIRRKMRILPTYTEPLQIIEAKPLTNNN